MNINEITHQVEYDDDIPLVLKALNSGQLDPAGLPPVVRQNMDRLEDQSGTPFIWNEVVYRKEGGLWLVRTTPCDCATGQLNGGIGHNDRDPLLHSLGTNRQGVDEFCYQSCPGTGWELFLDWVPNLDGRREKLASLFLCPPCSASYSRQF